MPPKPTPEESLDDQPDLARALHALSALVEQHIERHERRLPPERELCKRFGISRATLRRALAQLEQAGVLARHVGRGTFIAGGAQQAPPALNELSVLGALAIGSSPGLSPRELLEVRRVIEPAMAELAATSARPENILELKNCLREREAASGIDAYEHWDLQLHMAIAKATHNKLLIELLELVNRLRRTAGWRNFRRESIAPERKALSDEQHRAIVDAISQADPKLAFEKMRRHVGLMVGNYLAVDRDVRR